MKAILPFSTLARMEPWCPSAIERAMERPMPKPLPFLCASALALSLTACAGTINNSTADTASNVTFTFTDSGVTAAGETDTGYEIDGTALTITPSGTYTVSGSCADGSIKVKKGTTGVTLVLDGLTLTSENTAAITCGKSSEVTILVSNGTENSLSDTEQNNDDNYPKNENAENAVIKCKDGSLVTLCGDGELTITANGKNGIKSGATTDEDGEASLTIRDLTLNIDAPVNDAINAEQLLNVESGTLTIDAADDTIHCDLVLNIGADGTDGSTIDITNCCEGLEGAELNVCSGDITINASDDCLNAANSDLTDYDFTMTISGGTIDAYSSAGDGFDSNGDLTITGEMCPVDGSQDQLAVLSGMLAADRMYAFYFGDVSDAAKKNELLQQLVGKPLPTLNSKDMARIRKAPHSQESANILARFRQQELSRLLEAARQVDQLLRLLGAHLYGLYLERLYMASVMVLAAAESDTLEPLYQVHTGLATRHGKALEILGKKGLLGLEDCEARAALAKKLQGLLTANKGQPTLEGLREIVSLVQEERAFFLTPCPLPQ